MSGHLYHSNMTDPNSEIEKLIEKIEQYGKKTWELSKLQLLKHGVIALTHIISSTGILLMLILFVLFVSMGISLWIGEAMGKLSYGFFIVSSLYLLLLIVFYFFLFPCIKKPIANRIIKKVLSK